MKRFALKDLIAWKESKRRKPLIIEGARQVGKTWLVKEFAAGCYDNLVYINFEQQKFLRAIFINDFNIDRILDELSTASGQKITPGKTLIFLDEIQEAENGLTALKYFNEDAPEQHVIAAGSLLGLELHRSSSFPVGKVQFLTLRPMCFLEFLFALGMDNYVKYIEQQNRQALETFSPKIKELLKKYYFTGGMPEAVLTLVEGGSPEEVRTVQNDILRSYEFDFSKHAPGPIAPRIRLLWHALPAQLSKENRKFIYGVIKEGARARDFEDAQQWLIDSGLVYKVYNVTAPRIPLKSYEDPAAFKTFCLDVGLLGAMSDLDAKTVIDGNRIFTEFKGALTEQYVFQELVRKYSPYYFAKPNSQMEIDFLIQKNGEIIPIEVKAEENLRAKSLHLFVDANKSPRAFRISMSPYRAESWMTNIPLFCIDEI